jgi:multiple sugar transport system ATP-binding protein
MANLSLRHLYKVYPNGVKAVNDFSMDIDDKEFIVFVGPSGCGKSTTLRMIAGLEEITAGELFIGDTLVNDMEPKDRDVAMVFQNYALYPHLTVYDNMAFGLRLRHAPEEDVHRKVLWAAKILKLTDYLDRKPKAMSGGQRRRVALGRAILRNPKVFLLDEPLSNLDAKLRTEMRSEISKLHQELQTTFVYVTHDQVEAMTMGTRIVVMKLGWIQQIDTPKNLYDYPANKFVAGFIGTPQMNFFEATLRREGETVTIKLEGCDDILRVPFDALLKVRPKYMNGKEKVTMGIRCEHLSFDPEVVAAAENKVKVKISHFEELGAETLIYGDLSMTGDGYAETGTRIVVKSYKGDMGLKNGDVAMAAIEMGKVHFFDLESEKTIMPRLPEDNVFDCSVKDGVLSFLGMSFRLPEAIKCPDVEGAELFVPLSALAIGGKDFAAPVERIEEVGAAKIAYLRKNGRIFFVPAPESGLAIGANAALGLDFKRISIEKDGKELVKPFPESSAFLGAFTNLENAKLSVKALKKHEREAAQEKIRRLEKEKVLRLSEISYQPILGKELKEELKKRITELKADCSYRIGEEDFGKEGKKRLRAETAAKIAEAKAAYAAKIEELKAQKKKEATLPPEAKAAAEKAKAEIIGRYDRLIGEEKARLAKALALADASLADMLKWRGEERDLIRKSKADVDKMEAELKKRKEALRKEYDAQIAAKKKEFEECQGEAKDKAKISYLSLKNAKKNALLSLESDYRAREDEVLFASRPFFALIDGCAVRMEKDISRKIVKSLGLALFKSQFRYELPPNAFALAEKGAGLEAEVLETLDFGDGAYALCDSNGTRFYAKIKQKMPKGSHIRLMPDLRQAHIREDKYDIRLY